MQGQRYTARVSSVQRTATCDVLDYRSMYNPRGYALSLIRIPYSVNLLVNRTINYVSGWPYKIIFKCP